MSLAIRFCAMQSGLGLGTIRFVSGQGARGHTVLRHAVDGSGQLILALALALVLALALALAPNPSP